MEEVFKIEGGHQLNGEVRISGAKNATVALIPASILANGPVTICGVPDIADVESLSTLLEELNVAVVHKDRGHLIIDPTEMINRPLELDAERGMLAEAISKLGERERLIMQLRFGFLDGQERTQKQVADIIGISQSYISRLEKRIIRRLRRDLDKVF